MGLCVKCKKKACYNYEGRIAIVCEYHKHPGMIFIQKQKCAHAKCQRIARFNIPNEKQSIYCIDHKLPDMIDLQNALYDYDNKQGFLEQINKMIYESNQPILLVRDKKPEKMIHESNQPKKKPVENKNKCYKEDCDKIPKFNAPHKHGGMYCDEHKKMFMVNVVDSPCCTPYCTTRGLKKYEYHCLFCFVHLFPHSPLTRNYKTKEASVVEFVKTTFPHYTWINDKRVQDGCSRRRPDLLLDLGDQVLIIEIDENHHVDYECSCENKRIMELSQAVGHRPIVFIRFNPDSYVVDGQKVPSCWGLNDDGLCMLKDKPEWKRRLDALKQQMEYWIQERTPKTVEVVQLFY